MFDFLRWHQVKQDVAPGSLIYAGIQRDFTPFIHHYAYTLGNFSESQPKINEPLTLVKDHVNLIVAIGVHDSETTKAIGNFLDLSGLALEDVMHTGQRSKFAWTDNETGFIVMKHLDVKESKLETEQVSIFWRKELVVVFLEQESDLLDGLLSRIKRGKGRIRNAGDTYLLTAILDSLVDRHMSALAHFSDLTQDLEDQLGKKTTDELLGQLYELKRETIILRNMLIPVREIFKSLLREDAEISEIAIPYLRDVYGHHEQAVEGIMALHDILKSMIDYQISLIGIRTNKTMQFLTVIATIFIPLTFIAGVYGMNFQNMPELQSEYGYFYTLGGMGIIAIAMLVLFFRKRFL